MRKKSQDDVITSFRKIHRDDYDYSQVRYGGADKKVRIYCKECGSGFDMRPRAHARGQGCPDCGLRKMRNGKKAMKEDAAKKIVSRFQEVHGDRYDYSGFIYDGADKKGLVKCRCGNEFLILAGNHLKGKGCRVCSSRMRAEGVIASMSLQIVEDFRSVHGDKYDYSQVSYSGTDIRVKIGCRECKEVFFQTPASHKKGNGCRRCADRLEGVRRIRAVDEVIKDFEGVHGNRYDYSEMEYVRSDRKVEIICNDCREHFWQTPDHHRTGNGCPRCRESHGERAVGRELDGMGILFKRQKKFRGCRNIRELPFDFYFNHHGVPFVVEFNGGEEGFKDCVHRDSLKRDFCRENGIRMIKISHEVPREEFGAAIRRGIGSA